MNNNKWMIKQEGAVTLTISLVLLAIVTVVSITSFKIASNEIKMASNSIDKQKSLIAANHAVTQGWNRINSFSKIDFLDPCNKLGVYDLRATAPATCTTIDASGQAVTTTFTNTATAWNASKSLGAWPWDDSSHHHTLSQLSAPSAQMLTASEKANPMQLYQPPQYAIAIHDPIYQAGSTQVCFPVSIIGAAKGTLQETETIIEVRTVPANSCFPNI